MRWVLLASLTLLAVFAAVVLAQRTKPSGRTELALTTCILWNFLVGLPIYVLGLSGHLTAGALAVLSGVLFAGILVGAGWRGSVAASCAGLALGVVEIVTLPFDGLARTVRARSLVVMALTICAVLVVWTAFASYFTPSWRQWDSLWYHETIVGVTIQNHSFAPALLHGDTQKANGYPRFCEMIQLWFVIFTDRRLIELPNSLMAPGFMYATYLIARRYTPDVITCMAWAAVVLIMPDASYLLQSTYVDLHTALFVLAGTYYATRPDYRLADAWLAGICVALAIGSKYLALPPAGIILLIAFARLVRHHGFRLGSLGTMAGGGLIVGGMSAAVFWRNWKNFHNPLWPDFTYDNAARGIHIAGVSYGGANPLDMNMDLKELIPDLLSLPYSITSIGHKGQLYDYGFAVIWIIFPFSALALCAILFLCARDAAGGLFRLPGWRAPEAWNALLVALPVVAQVILSPALWGGRYHIANVGALAGLVAFLGGRPRWRAFGEGAAVAAAVASVIVFYWTKPRWYWLPSELAALAAIPYPEREVTPAVNVSHAIDVHSGAAVTREFGLEREKMKPGDVIAYEYTQFPALLWNNSFTNKVVFLDQGPGTYIERVNAVGASYAHCQNGTPGCTELAAASTGAHPTWKDLGSYNVENWAHVYERLPAAPAKDGSEDGAPKK